MGRDDANLESDTEEAAPGSRGFGDGTNAGTYDRFIRDTDIMPLF